MLVGNSLLWEHVGLAVPEDTKPHRICSSLCASLQGGGVSVVVDKPVFLPMAALLTSLYASLPAQSHGQEMFCSPPV